eukprot:scaffold295123_cov16-Tisochrysis_lutea.AAC.1
MNNYLWFLLIFYFTDANFVPPPWLSSPLQFPFWIVINQSVFTDEANKDKPEFGFKETNLVEHDAGHGCFCMCPAGFCRAFMTSFMK